MDDATKTTLQRQIGAELEGSGKQFFENVVLDNILESLLELTAAVWTYRDRAIILEAVLTDVVGKDKDIGALIEAYVTSPEEDKARAAERAELVTNVFRSFSRRPVSEKSTSGSGEDS